MKSTLFCESHNSHFISSKLKTEISKLNKSILLLQEEINKRDLTIEEYNQQINKEKEAERDLQKYMKKTQKLKHIREELQEENENVFILFTKSTLISL